MARTPTMVDAGTPELDTGTGRPGLVRFELICPFSPYGKPHKTKVEVLLDEW